MDLWTSELNYPAIIILTAANMAVGFWWYAPRFGLGDVWLRLLGKTEEELRAKGGPNVAFAAVIAGSLVTSYVLALVIHLTGAADFAQGAIVGLWVWAGLVAATSVGRYVFGGQGLKLWAFDNAYFLVTVTLIAGVLGAWSP